MNTLYLVGGGVALIALLVYGYRKLGEKFGRTKAERDIAKEEAEKLHDAVDAVVNGPRNKSDIVDRLRGDDKI